MEGCVGAPLKARWAHKIRCFSCCNPPTKPPQYAFVSLLNGDEEQIFSHSFHQFRCCSIRNLPKDGSKFLAHDDAVESTSPSRMLPIRRRLIQQAEARGVARGIRLSYISRLNLHRFRRFFFSIASNINSLLVKDTRSKFFTLLYHGYSILLLPRSASSCSLPVSPT